MEKDYKKVYLKDNYNKYNNLFNIWALLFGGFYLLYKKIYLLGIIVLILYLISYIFKIYYLIVIINIILFITFNRLYIKFIEHKIENYKLEYMDNRMVNKECSKNNNNIMIVVFSVLIIIILLLISNIKFNEKNIRMNNIGFRLESEWVKGNYNNKYYSVYNYKNSCSVTVEIMGYYNDIEYLNDILSNYDSGADIKDIKINNMDYKMINVDNNYVYTTYIDNDLYVFIFDIYDDKDLCNKYRTDILNSVVIYK